MHRTQPMGSRVKDHARAFSYLVYIVFDVQLEWAEARVIPPSLDQGVTGAGFRNLPRAS